MLNLNQFPILILPLTANEDWESFKTYWIIKIKCQTSKNEKMITWLGQNWSWRISWINQIWHFYENLTFYVPFESLWRCLIFIFGSTNKINEIFLIVNQSWIKVPTWHLIDIIPLIPMQIIWINLTNFRFLIFIIKF